MANILWDVSKPDISISPLGGLWKVVAKVPFGRLYISWLWERGNVGWRREAGGGGMEEEGFRRDGGGSMEERVRRRKWGLRRGLEWNKRLICKY